MTGSSWLGNLINLKAELSLGSIASQASSAVSITGGSLSGVAITANNLAVAGPATFSNAALLSTAPALASTNSALQNAFTFAVNDGNADQLRLDFAKQPSGATNGWATTYLRLYRNVDSTPMGYLQFGSNYSAGVANVELGIGNTSVLALSSGNVSIFQPLSISGAASFSSTIFVNGAATLSSTLAVAGATTLSGMLTVAGTTSFGSGVSTTFLSASGAASIGTTLNVTGVVTFGSTMSVTGNASFGYGLSITAGNLTAGAATFSSSVAAQSLTINGSSVIDSSRNGSLANLAITGTTAFPTAVASDNSQTVATTAMVQSAIVYAASPGDIKYSARSSAPSGWLVADGSAVSRTTYSALFAAITISSTGTLTSGSTAVSSVSSTIGLAVGMMVSGAGIPAGATIAAIGSGTITLSANATSSGTITIIASPYGIGDGSTTFNLPDLRGVFVRGVDNSRGLDTGRTLGSYQADMLASHYHDTNMKSTLQTGNSGYGITSSGGFQNKVVVTGYGNGLETGSTGSPETAPKNVALLALIKY